MNFAKLKAKNQVTIPSAIIKRLHLRPHELFTVDIKNNFIKLTPVDVEPRYTVEELQAIDRIVEQEKTKAKRFKSEKELSAYIRKASK